MPTASHTVSRVGRSWPVRVRVIALVLAMLALGLTLAGLVTFSVQFAQLNQRVQGELLQEVDELRFIGEQGPEAPYSDLEMLFEAYLLVSLPNEHESMLTMVDGAPARWPGGELAFDLNVPEVRAEVERTLQPGRAVLTDFQLREGDRVRDLRLVVASVALPNDPRQGALVVAVDIGAQRADIWAQVGTYSLVALGTIVVTGATGYVVAGRLLRPLAELTEAAATIDTEDLTQRVRVSEAGNDVAQLAQRFNQMLDRLEEGVAQQRQFLDDAAHELRTPLTIIRGNLELMEVGDAEDVDQTRVLVLDELDRMKRLVDDLLLLARSQRPDFVTPTPIDVKELGDELKDRVHLLGDRDWETHSTVQGAVVGDRQRLQQAVIQLAANAAKFSSPGDRIEVRLDWSPPTAPVLDQVTRAADRYLVISVRDTGVGIAPDQVERIFERFGRGAETGNIEGFGLGLPIVQAIALAHGGAVTLDSQLGAGSTFRLWIPADHP